MPEFSEPIDVDPSIAEANRGIIETIPPNAEDFEDVRRGLLAVPPIPAIPARRQGDRVVWNFVSYDFLSDSEVSDAPPSVNRSLWRQGMLTAQAGLFQVASYGRGAIYQVRGYDLSNMTIIEGDSGIVIINPLASYETAQWALKLYRDTTENKRPIVGIIYTHSHVDHFGGVRGLFHDKDGVVDSGIPIIAPDGFLEHAVSENVYAGPAMARRSEYMYAASAGSRLFRPGSPSSSPRSQAAALKRGRNARWSVTPCSSSRRLNKVRIYTSSSPVSGAPVPLTVRRLSHQPALHFGVLAAARAFRGRAEVAPRNSEGGRGRNGGGDSCQPSSGSMPARCGGCSSGYARPGSCQWRRQPCHRGCVKADRPPSRHPLPWGGRGFLSAIKWTSRWADVTGV
ncbi:MBL fold metallo-hydrolase [Streptomyces sp. NPDC051162]|uniref:MBL fold metallo-hydrolase n=1 Tax=Streptomyces sp. NPDC051162 TaxID=3154747 RepID=UPI00341684F3